MTPLHEASEPHDFGPPWPDGHDPDSHYEPAEDRDQSAVRRTLAELVSIGDDVLTDYASTTCDNVEKCACSMGRLWRALSRCCENGTPGSGEPCADCSRCGW